MATSTRSNRSGSRSRSSSSRSSSSTANANTRAAQDNVEAAADRIRDLNERILESSKKAGNVYVDMYEKTLKTIADYQEKAGQQSQVDWVQTMASAQADFTRQLTDAFTSASRKALK
jgi:hypothetical protein